MSVPLNKLTWVEVKVKGKEINFQETRKRNSRSHSSKQTFNRWDWFPFPILGYKIRNWVFWHKQNVIFHVFFTFVAFSIDSTQKTHTHQFPLIYELSKSRLTYFASLLPPVSAYVHKFSLSFAINIGKGTRKKTGMKYYREYG